MSNTPQISVFLLTSLYHCIQIHVKVQVNVLGNKLLESSGVESCPCWLTYFKCRNTYVCEGAQRAHEADNDQAQDKKFPSVWEMIRVFIQHSGDDRLQPTELEQTGTVITRCYNFRKSRFNCSACTYITVELVIKSVLYTNLWNVSICIVEDVKSI